MVTVIVNFQVEGIHSWPDCPLREVDFLVHPHRHIFHITMEKEVSHNDRDVEIIMLKRMAERYLRRSFLKTYGCCDFGSQSCEMIAKHLLDKFNLFTCQVLEDGENGAKVYK